MPNELENKARDEALRKAEEYFNMSLPEKFNYAFIKYLEEFNQSKEIIELAKKINWELITEIYINKINILSNKFVIPKNIDVINAEGLKSGFYASVIQNSQHALFYYLFQRIKEHIKLNNSIETLNDNITKYLSPIIKIFLDSYYFQFALTDLNESNNESVTIIIIEKLKKLAAFAEKFWVKKEFKPAEIPLYERILKEYEEALQSDYKKSFKTIAYHVAKTELKHIVKEDQNRFYKRFMTYKKRKVK